MSGRDKLLLAFLVVTAWLLRVQFARDYEAHHPLAQIPVIDEASYERWALRLARGEPSSHEVFFQEPLYPFFLGGVYRLAAARLPAELEGPRVLEAQRTAARHLQAFLGAVTVLLTFLLARRAFGKAAGFAAAAALALYEPLLLFPSYLLKPNLFLPVLTGLLLLLVSLSVERLPRLRNLAGWFLAGVLGALAALLRGNALVLLPVLLALPFLRSRRRAGEPRLEGLAGAALSASVCTWAGITAVLLPVAMRNLAVSGVFALTTVGAGTNLYGGNSPENPYGVATELSFVRGIPEYELEDWQREAERRLGREVDPGEVSSFWLRETLRSFAERPLVHATILWRKLRLALGAYEVPDNRHLGWDARYWPLARLPFPGYAVVGWLGLAGMLYFVLARDARRLERRPGHELLAVYLLYLGTIVLTVMSQRARLALVPLLACFAGYLVTHLTRAHAPRALLALALAALPVFWPVMDGEARLRDLDERELNFAVYQLRRQGPTPEVAGIAHELAARHPRSARIRILACEVDFLRAQQVLEREDASTGEREAARSQIAAALDLLRRIVADESATPRETFRARKLAGMIQLQLESAGPAERHLRAALDFDPTDELCRLGLANALYLRAIEQAPSDETRAWLYESEGLLLDLLTQTEPGQGPDDLERLLRLVRSELVR